MGKSKVGFILFLSALGLSLFFSGCASNNNSIPLTIDKIQPIDLSNNSGLSQREKELIVYFLNNNGVIEEEERTVYLAKGGAYRIKLKATISLEKDKLVVKDGSSCPKTLWLCTTNDPEYATFLKKVNDRKNELAQKLPNYFEEYKLVKSNIDNWLLSIGDVKPVFVFKNENSLNLKKETLDKIKETIFYGKESLSSEQVFANYKNSNIQDLKEFLSKRSVIQYKPYSNIVYKNYYLRNYDSKYSTYINDDTILHGISLETAKTGVTITNNALSYLFLPDQYEFKNSNISVTFTREYYNQYSVHIKNLTDNYIDVEAISLYYGEKITPLKGNRKVSPYGTTQERIIIELETNSLLIDIKNGTETNLFGGAIDYSIKGKKDTLFKSMDITFPR